MNTGFPNVRKAALAILLFAFCGYDTLHAQVSYSENFETNTANDWTAIPNATASDICGGTAALFNLYAGEPSWIFSSPSVGNSLGGQIVLSYEYVLQDYGTNDATSNSTDWGMIEVQWSTDEATWNTIRTINNTNHIESASCATLTDTFASTAGPLYVRFVATHNSGDYDLAVDNVALQEYTGTCTGTPTPGATLSSTAVGCANSPFTLSLQNPTATFGTTYLWQVSTNGGANWSTAPGDADNATYTTTQTVTTSYRAQVSCNGATAVSTPETVTMSANIAACYCIPVANCTDEDVILQVSFEGINHASVCGTDGYEDLTAIDTATVAAGNSYTMDVTVGDGGDEYVSVWIDYNQDGSFSEDEYSYLGNGNDEVITGSVAIAVNALTGYTRMRIATWYGDALQADQPCLSNDYGEYEDYTINITSAAPCAGVPAPGATLASDSSFICAGDVALQLETTPSGSGIVYQWEVSTDNGTNWTDIAGATNSQYNTTITGTSQFRALATCTVSGSSAYAAPVSINVQAPTPGMIIAEPNPVCASSPFFIVPEFAEETGVNYAWYSSVDSINYTPTGDTIPIFLAYDGITTDVFYQLIATCAGSNLADTSAIIAIRVKSEGFPETFEPAGEFGYPAPCGWTFTSDYTEGVEVNGYAVASAEGSGSALFNFYSAASTDDTLDMRTHNFAPTDSGTYLRFDYAYATFIDEVDSLEILVTTDSGTTFAHLTGYGGGVSGTLTTAPATIDEFEPTTPEEWATKMVQLPAGVTSILFRGHTAHGNNLYIDNIGLCQMVTPTVTIDFPATICYLSEATFTATGTNLGTEPMYTWYRNSSEIEDTTTAFYTTPNISKYNTEDITVTVSNTGACIADTVSATITTQAVSTPNPAVIATGSRSFCEGNSVDLVHNGNAANVPLNYSWIKDSTGEVSTIANYTATQTGTYQLTVTDPATSCARQSAPQVITVKPNPIVDATENGPLAICPAGSVVLANNTVEPGVTYRWKRDGVTNVSTTSSYTTKTNGSYTLTATLNGCAVTSSAFDVYVIAVPDVTVSANGPTALCAGGSVLFSAADIAGYTYQWYNGTTPITNETTGEYLATAAGSYKVAISNNGCVPKNSAVTKVTLTTLPAATITPTAQTASSVTLRGNNGTVYGYQWYLNGSPIPGANGQYHTATVNGSYTLELSRNGCTVMSNPKTVAGLTGTSKLGVEEEHQAIAVYPNPSEGIFNIASEDAVNVIVRDVQGRIITTINNAAQVDLTAQPAGMYLMQIMDAKGNLLQNERLIRK